MRKLKGKGVSSRQIQEGCLPLTIQRLRSFGYKVTGKIRIRFCTEQILYLIFHGLLFINIFIKVYLLIKSKYISTCVGSIQGIYHHISDTLSFGLYENNVFIQITA